MNKKTPITETLYINIILYLYENGETEAGLLGDNVTSKYVEKGKELKKRGVLKIKRSDNKKKRIYYLTNKGEKIAQKIKDINNLLEKSYGKKCPECDSELESDAQFCKYCGHQL